MSDRKNKNEPKYSEAEIYAAAFWVFVKSTPRNPEVQYGMRLGVNELLDQLGLEYEGKT